MTSFGSDDDLRGAAFTGAVLDGATFERTTLDGAVFEDSSLKGIRVHDTSLSGSTFHHVSMVGVRIEDATLERLHVREADLEGAVMDGVNLTGATITGDIGGLTINEVEIEPLVEAELNRRHPERPLLQADDAETMRRGWAWLVDAWAGTTAEALAHPESSLRLEVDGEWSFLQTLRHLVFATDCWFGVGVLGRTAYHPMGLAGTWFDPASGGLDYERAWTVEEILAVRAERVAEVGAWLGSADDAALDARFTSPAEMPWPDPRERSARQCLHVILEEEWWHRRFMLRDMARWPA